MTREEASEKTDQELKRLDTEMREIMERALHSKDNGWDRPPAQLPRFGEIAMGIVYDPKRNTR